MDSFPKWDNERCVCESELRPTGGVGVDREKLRRNFSVDKVSWSSRGTEGDLQQKRNHEIITVNCGSACRGRYALYFMTIFLFGDGLIALRFVGFDDGCCGMWKYIMWI